MAARLGAAVLAVCGAMVPSPAQAQQDTAPLQRMAWLSGCWEGMVGTRTVEEHWLPLRAGTLVSASRATSGDRTTSVELAVLAMRGDTLAYHAYPVGQSPAVFDAVALTDSAATFANPAHDFPQRIIYRRVGADSLVARIEGPGENGPRGFDYHMRRAVCPASAALEP